MTLKEKNERLTKQLEEAKEIIAELHDTIHLYENNNLLLLWDSFQTITNAYDPFLNPAPVMLKAAFNGKHEEFLLRCTDILCITCTGKVKTVHLIKSIENNSGNYRETDKIIVDNNDGLETFRRKRDSIGYHLIQVNRSTVVNMKYYDLKGDMLEITGEVKSDLNKIPISPSHIEDFKIRKQLLTNLASLQKSISSLHRQPPAP